MVNILCFKQTWRERVFKLAARLKRRFSISLAVVALALVGCTAIDPASVPGTVGDATARPELLQPWIELTGANLGASLAPPGLAGGSGYVVLRQPTAISARGNDVYLLDVGLHHIFR